MFERYTERARQTIVLAQDEARHLKHNYIGTEHLLLGLLREEEGLAARTLDALGITADDVRRFVGRIVGHGNEIATGQIPFTPRAKKVLELSLREALGLGHNYVGTEHVLLGLVRENEGVAIRYFDAFGVTAEMIRQEIGLKLAGPGRSAKKALTEASLNGLNATVMALLKAHQGEIVTEVTRLEHEITRKKQELREAQDRIGVRRAQLADIGEALGATS